MDTFWGRDEKAVADRNAVHGGFRAVGTAKGSKYHIMKTFHLISDRFGR